MSTPDPFSAFESERTIIKPKPRGPANGGAGAPPPPQPLSDAAAGDIADMAVLSPLVSAAAPLLLLAARLRNMVMPGNAAAMRMAASSAVQRFDAAARQAGYANEVVLGARYVLCTAVDEAVANTPWGVQSGWNKQSLLVQFHNETWGGEKVFQLLSRLAQDVPANRPLLELIYCVLALGFEGRYRVIDNGRAQLDSVRQRLAELIRKHRPPVEAELSPHWRGAAPTGTRLSDALPLWVIGTALLLLLAATWAGLQAWLNHRSDQTFAAIAGLQVPHAPVAAPAAVVAREPRLARFLEPEIREGLVSVTDQADRSVVQLRGDSFFGSGSAEPTSRALPVLERIGQALAAVKGDVLVVGHSDNQPIRSMRFPSNWHLSSARAEAVKAALAQQVPAGRMHAEGKADAEPIAPNDSAANRARNRRVDVILMAGPAGAPPARSGEEPKR